MLFSFGCALFVTMATKHVDLQCVSFLNHGKEVLLCLSKMARDFYISPQLLLKLISKHKKIAKILLFSLDFVLFVAINLQIVLFLIHEIQEFRFKHDDGRYLYQSTKVAKIELKTPKVAKVCFLFGCVIFVAMASRRLNSPSVLFLNPEIQELLLSMMIRDIYTSLQKLLKMISKHPK